jgi:hypothetical protein
MFVDGYSDERRQVTHALPKSTKNIHVLAATRRSQPPSSNALLPLTIATVLYSTCVMSIVFLYTEPEEDLGDLEDDVDDDTDSCVVVVAMFSRVMLVLIPIKVSVRSTDIIFPPYPEPTPPLLLLFHHRTHQHLPMEPSTGLDSATLNRLHTTLSSQQVSREFHAFTRLCPPSAAQRLLALTPEELSRLSEQCHVAINAWLCCDRTYEVERDAPSLTTRDSTLPGKVSSPTFPFQLDLRLTYLLFIPSRPKPETAHALSPECIQSSARQLISSHTVLASPKPVLARICGRYCKCFGVINASQNFRNSSSAIQICLGRTSRPR